LGSLFFARKIQFFVAMSYLGQMTTFHYPWDEEEVRDTKGPITLIGPMGSGRTTLLRVLDDHVDPNERIIVLDDIVELDINKYPNA
jgi:ABC-type Fe3+/spermidine/putrescine transport system ATPase subunit